ncbi:MAG TPA: M20/M25/M40 family metallo-hydrolase [Thermoanaerobaculia bacterium]|jgi:acetylornithine deacetylase/succinyl-diaminopimelate desuccinylase-like protein|nr:M20/M25/M40 family metallo-hydrolase [Thermoanaerobaculia bacterium]
MLSLRRLAAPALLFCLMGSLECRRAAGGSGDPVEREAETSLVSYLRIDTSNPPGNETAGARFLQQLLAKEGIEAKLVGSDPDRQSLYARLVSGSNEKALVLLHHIDVVPAVAGEWTKPPFAGLRSGGYIWGRGALDIKSLGIAELMAFVDLKRRHLPLRRDVIYLAVADEELGGNNGCGALLDQHPELFTNAGFVLNEGGYNETIVDHVPFWGIEVQAKVPLWLRITMKGGAGHASSPPDDGGALAKLVRSLNAIQEIPMPYRLTPAVARSFHEAGKARNDERGEVLRGMAEPLDTVRLERVLSPGYRSLLHDTVAITRITGGVAINVLPTTASADVDIRLLPDEATAPMLAKVKGTLPNGGDLQVLLAGLPVPESPSDTELFRVLAAAMKKAEPGSIVAPVVGGGTSDSRFFRARGIVAYGIAPFKVNYYDADTVHGNDERIRARFFAEGVRLMRTIVTDFCAKGVGSRESGVGDRNPSELSSGTRHPTPDPLRLHQ